MGKGVGAGGGEIILNYIEQLKVKRGRSWRHYFEVGCIITGFDDAGTEREREIIGFNAQSTLTVIYIYILSEHNKR